MLEIWLRYDLRNPSWVGIKSTTLAAAALEQVEWADKHGFHTIQLPEHHCSADNYNPSPLMLGAAMAARTSKIRLQPSAILLPLHDPVRIAEDLAILDVISNGRLDVTIGLGYVPDEFAMFGIDLKDRAQLVDAKLRVLKRAFAGETFDYEGRTVHVTPPPVQPGGPRLWIGGSLKATARRAAELGDGYYPMVNKPELIQAYKDACSELGKEPGRIVDVTGPRHIHISEDPDAAWARIAPHALHETNAYAAYAAKLGQTTNFKHAENADALRAAGSYQVLTPEDGLTLLRQQRDLGRSVILAPLLAGLDPDLAWESLELIGTRIIPQLVQDDAVLA
ncbi:LLM class flavin-dependent oxidoreductase [Sphingobium sp. AN641]|uniref:LLM class flavin-dependent oxidoreductase n=1 Tax=Sphingobium sp. AN641 TaxID=3133443 RepID=UPI0030BC2D70